MHFSDPHFRHNFLGFAHSPKPSMKLAHLVEQNATIPPNRKIQENDDPTNSLEIHTDAQEEHHPNFSQHSTEIHAEIHLTFIKNQPKFTVPTYRPDIGRILRPVGLCLFPSQQFSAPTGFGRVCNYEQFSG